MTFYFNPFSPDRSAYLKLPLMWALIGNINHVGMNSQNKHPGISRDFSLFRKPNIRICKSPHGYIKDKNYAVTMFICL